MSSFSLYFQVAIRYVMELRTISGAALEALKGALKSPFDPTTVMDMDSGEADERENQEKSGEEGELENEEGSGDEDEEENDEAVFPVPGSRALTGPRP